MEPIKIKLRNDEAWRIVQYCAGATAYSSFPESSLELIVLAEFSEKIATQHSKNRLRSRFKVYLYTLPISVARILHRRWQDIAYDDDRQMVLKAIDYELTNRNLKPDPKNIVIV